LPSDNKKQIISVNIPNAYLMLVTIFAHYMTFTEVVDDLNIPPLRARIDYGDIGEKIFSLEYDFTFSVSIIKNNGADVSGLIKATRVEKSPLAIGLAKEAALISASMVFPGADNFISAALSLGKRQKK